MVQALNNCSRLLFRGARIAHLLVEIIAAKLDSRIWHNSNAIRAIPSHEASPSFILPHLHETFPHRALVVLTSNTLYLEENLEPFKRRHNCPRYSSCHSTSTESCNHRLCNQLPELVYFRSIFGLKDIVPGLSHASVQHHTYQQISRNSRQTFPSGIESFNPRL